MTIPPPGFTGSPLDRVEVERIDPAAFARAIAEPGALLLDLDGYQPRADGGGALAWLPLRRGLPDSELVLLGRIGGVARFAHLVPGLPPARRAPALIAVLEGLQPGEAATYGIARGLLDWHARHRFCAFCGAATAPARAGWMRLCPTCGTEHFPRTDPVVIMLAEHRDADGRARVLLGRQPAFPPGRYSALAGFVEVGEAMEEAVRRELFEEAGVTAGAVRYVASQPWPFPSQLMIACIAEVAEPAIRLDTTELEDAMWVDRAGVRAALAGAAGAPFQPPPDYAIASTLLRAWLDD